MSVYDIAMLVVLLGAVWFGYSKGLAWQIASLAAVVVSYIVAFNFRDAVSPLLKIDPPWNRIGAMLILFLGTSLAIWTIYGSIKQSINKLELKGFDRQAGALLGAAKGALLCMVITMFAVSLLGERVHDTILYQSRFGPYVVSGITQVSAIVPNELQAYVQPHIEEFQNQIGQAVPPQNGIAGPGPLGAGSQYQISNSQTPATTQTANNPLNPSQWFPPSPQTNPGNAQPPQNNNFQPGQFYGGQNTNWTSQPQPPAQSGGSFFGNGNTTPQSNTPNTSGGFGNFNFDATQASQQLLDAAARATVDAVRRAADGGNQQQ